MSSVKLFLAKRLEAIQINSLKNFSLKMFLAQTFSFFSIQLKTLKALNTLKRNIKLKLLLKISKFCLSFKSCSSTLNSAIIFCVELRYTLEYHLLGLLTSLSFIFSFEELKVLSLSVEPRKTFYLTISLFYRLNLTRLVFRRKANKIRFKA